MRPDIRRDRDPAIGQGFVDSMLWDAVIDAVHVIGEETEGIGHWFAKRAHGGR